jgi:hypothetical protein
VVGCCECGDEPLGSCAMELISRPHHFDTALVYVMFSVKYVNQDLSFSVFGITAIPLCCTSFF